MSAYVLYYKDASAKLLKSNPNLTLADLSTKISGNWANTSDKDKKKYETKEAEGKKAYEKEKK